MEKEKLIKKIESYKLMSNFRISLLAVGLTILRFVNNKIFYLACSLIFGFFLSFLFKIPFLIYLITHLIIWKLFSDRLLNKKEIDKDNLEMSFVISELNVFLKQKKV